MDTEAASTLPLKSGSHRARSTAINFRAELDMGGESHNLAVQSNNRVALNFSELPPLIKSKGNRPQLTEV